MVENGIRGGICLAIHLCEKANNKCMKNYNKNKELSNLKYWDVNNLCGWVMSQNFSADGFKSVETISQITENFIKSYNEDSDEEGFLEADV